MKPNKRQKLCYHCEGEVDLDVIVCPFCAADLRVERPPAERFSSPSIGKPTPSLFGEPNSEAQPLLEAAPEKPVNLFHPTICFTVGLQLFLFGLFMLLFSHKGIIILKWNAHLWFLYILASLPCLFFGYKALSKL